MESTKTWHTEDSVWKAEQIKKLLNKIDAPVTTVAEIGCGAGRVIHELSKHSKLHGAKIFGFDTSETAIELCGSIANPAIEYACSDPLAETDSSHFDLLLAIDVFEHVPDYMGFLGKCQSKASFKIYHIPLDVHVSSVLRDSLLVARKDVGHLHYFTASTALATLEDTNHRIIECIYTDAATGLFHVHRSIKRGIANVPRWITARASTALSARLFGGYSLLVLAE